MNSSIDLDNFKLNAEEAITHLRTVSQQLEAEQKEKRLLHQIAAAASLHDALQSLIEYLGERWGFDACMVQLVNTRKNCLYLYKVYGYDMTDPSVRQCLDVEAPLVHHSSISAYVALKQRVFYADFAKTTQDQIHRKMDLDAVNTLQLKENLILPIIDTYNNKTIGVIHLIAKSRRLNLTPESIVQIGHFIKNMTPSIVSEKRKDELEKLRIEQEQTILLVRRINSTINLPQLLSILGVEALKADAFDGYLITLADKSRHNLICEAVKLPKEYEAIEKTYIRFTHPVSTHDALSHAFKSGQIGRYDRQSIKAFNDTTRHLFTSWKLRSMVVIPLKHSLSTLGVIALFKQHDDIRDEAVHRLECLFALFREQLNNAIFYSRLKSEERAIQNAAELNERFLQFIADANNLTSVELIYRQFSEEFLTRYQFDFAVCHIFENDALVFKRLSSVDHDFASIHLSLQTFFEAHPYSLHESEGAAAMAFLKNVDVVIEDAQQILTLPMSKKDRVTTEITQTLRTVLHIPICRQNHPIGVMGLFSLKNVIKLSDSDLKIIKLLCGFMGTALANARLYAKVGEQKSEIELTLSELRSTQEQLVQTERSRLEAMRIAKDAAEASAKAKSAFLANMSHEIRTPMNAIIGFSDLMDTAELPERQRDYLKKIRNASRSLLGIINDILDLSKIEAGKMDIELIPFYLSDVIDPIADLFSHSLAEKGLDLIFHIDPAVPSFLFGDPLRLTQIFVNLISNAIKFTEHGHIDVAIHLSESSGISLVLDCSVSDTGIGIAPEKLSSLFDSFTQADESTTRRFGGTGLGLSICKHLIAMMGGEITVRSEPGSGSCFSFTLLTTSLSAYDTRHIDSRLRALLGAPPVLLIGEPESPVLSMVHSELKPFSPQIEALGTQSPSLLVPSMLSAKLVIIETPQQTVWLSDLLDSLQNHVYELHSFPPVIFLDTLSYPVSEHAPNLPFSYRALHKPITPNHLQSSVLELLQLSDATPPDTSSCQDNDYASLLFGKTVLLVEDNEINQMVATEILSQWGIQVEVASNGRDALEQLSNRVPDIVLTDIQMPVMDGCELATQIRHTAHLSHLPIIAITADAMTGDRERFLSSGINDYISKPFDAQKLAELLVHWISSTTASSSAGRGSPSSPSTISLPSLTPGSDELLSSWQDLLPSQFLALTLDSSLNRLNGNVSLYLCILEAFCTHHSAISDKILDALNQADSILALRTIHSYRSLAHAIGAERAVMMGRKVEEHLRHGHYKKAIERLSELRSQMDYVIDSFTLLTAVYVNPLDQPFEERIHLFCQKMANSLSSGCAETIQDYVRSFKEISQKLGDDADIHSLCLDFDHGNLHSALQSLEMTLPDLERFS